MFIKHEYLQVLAFLKFPPKMSFYECIKIGKKPLTIGKPCGIIPMSPKWTDKTPGRKPLKVSPKNSELRSYMLFLSNEPLVFIVVSANMAIPGKHVLPIGKL
jgi:hypothetical protein